MTKVETFNSFNKGMRRPDRRRHLELCGFKLSETSIYPRDHDMTPKQYANRRAKAMESECIFSTIHLVYMIGGRDYDGWPYYEIYSKTGETAK